MISKMVFKETGYELVKTIRPPSKESRDKFKKRVNQILETSDGESPFLKWDEVDDISKERYVQLRKKLRSSCLC